MKDLILAIWRDPRLFNFFIMSIYAGAMVRWTFAGKWADVAYWFFALGITATVTFGYKR